MASPSRTRTVTVVENCEERFQFLCPRLWSGLQTTGSRKVRYCGTCEKKVYQADTVEEGRALAREGKCVALRRAPIPFASYRLGMMKYDG